MGAGDLIVQFGACCVRCGLQACESHVDTGERLGDDVMQFAADLAALLLLHE